MRDAHHSLQVFVAVFALVAAASAGVIPATTLVRAPSHDSAIIQSDRIGGNFAYSSVEGHAYAAVSPVVQNVVSPVGISYSATPVATPINLVHQQLQYVATPQFITAPQLIAHQGLYTQPAVISPVAPGIFAPSFPIAASENLIPVAPDTPKEAEKPAEESTIIQAAPEPAAPAPAEDISVAQPAPQADDVVAVESL